jgi:glycerol-3-phosphate acyltransferase PlsY
VTALEYIGVIILCYLIGAIPFGVIMGRLTRGIDVRQYGSGSIGMTNVLRIVGARAGAIVFAADVGKGAAAVALAGFLLTSPAVEWGQVAGGSAAVIGHCWPVYIGFRGGRGINTGFGAILLMAWPVALFSLAAFLITFILFRYVSLSSMVASLTVLVALIPLVAVDEEPFAYLAFALVAVPIIIFRHRGNIQRLLTGMEPKIGEKAG